jgi:hypothetical protein
MLACSLGLFCQHVCLFVFTVLGSIPRALHMLSKHCTTELFPQPPILICIWRGTGVWSQTLMLARRSYSWASPPAQPHIFIWKDSPHICMCERCCFDRTLTHHCAPLWGLPLYSEVARARISWPPAAIIFTQNSCGLFCFNPSVLQVWLSTSVKVDEKCVNAGRW